MVWGRDLDIISVIGGVSYGWKWDFVGRVFMEREEVWEIIRGRKKGRKVEGGI